MRIVSLIRTSYRRHHALMVVYRCSHSASNFLQHFNTGTGMVGQNTQVPIFETPWTPAVRFRSDVQQYRSLQRTLHD